MSRPVALIVGATGGIGRACARGLAEDGYELLLTARRTEPLRELAAELGALWEAGDSASEEDVARIVDRAPRINLVVHAAGIMQGTFVRSQQAETFDAVLRTNLRSAYLVAAAAVPRMSAGGRLIFISSTAGLKGMPGLTAYSAAKAGMNAMAQALAGELERDGINVHLVTPAPVDTAMLNGAVHSMAVLDPGDVADAVRWLARLAAHVVVREIVMRAVTKGPFATRWSRGGGTESPVEPIGDSSYPPAADTQAGAGHK